MPEKKCTRCKETKPLSAFSVRKSGKRAGEYLTWCKPCNSRAVIEYHQANPEKNREAQRLWRAANSDKAKAQWARARMRCVERDPLYYSKQHAKYRDSRLVYYRAHYRPKNTPPRTMGYSAERRREIALIASAARWGVFKYDALRNSISLTERIGNSELTLAHTIASSEPNVLERMVASEGVWNVIQRLAREYRLPVEQAQAIAEAVISDGYTLEGGVYDLADRLRHGWQAERLTTNPPKVIPRFERPPWARAT